MKKKKNTAEFSGFSDGGISDN